MSSVLYIVASADLKESVKDDEDLPKYIVGMLRLDYFDDAVGQVEGFQIFGDIMQHGNVFAKSRILVLTLSIQVT